MALGGWLGTLADPGGSRGGRARALAAFTLLGVMVVAATSVEEHENAIKYDFPMFSKPMPSTEVIGHLHA